MNPDSTTQPLQRIGRNPIFAERRIAKVVLPPLLMLLIFLGHSISPVSQSGDSGWAIPLALSILYERDLDLDEYASQIAPTDSRIDRIGGHYYSYFPYGTSLISLPFVLLATLFDPQIPVHTQVAYPELEIVIASAIVAATSTVMYAIARQRHLSVLTAFFTTLLFAFGTSVWSTASRALWQHGPSILMLSLGIYLLGEAEKNPRRIQYVALPLAFAYIIRPTNSIAIVVISLYVLLRYRNYFGRYLLWGGAVALLFFAINFSTLGILLPRYFLPERVGSTALFWTALVGNLISPARGLFIFTPITLLILACVTQRIRKLKGIEWVSLTIILLHWLLISTFLHWWGGWSYGPRFFTDMLPFFWVLLFPLVRGYDNIRWSLGFRTIFLLLAAVGVFIHLRGAVVAETYAPWSALPVNIEKDRSRLWNWKDPQFLRGLTGLDGFVPPDIRVTPPEGIALHDIDDPASEWLSFRVANYAIRPLEWSVIGSADVLVITSEVPGGIVGTVAVGVPFTALQPMDNHFSIFVIGVNSFGKRQVVEIPFTIRLDDLKYLFLPLIYAP